MSLSSHLSPLPSLPPVFSSLTPSVASNPSINSMESSTYDHNGLFDEDGYWPDQTFDSEILPPAPSLSDEELPFLSLLPPFAPLRPDHRYGTPEPPPHPDRYVAPVVDPFPPYIRPRSASPSRYTIRGVVVVEPKGSKSNPIVIKDHDHPAKRRRPDDDHVGNQVVKAVPQPPRPTQPPASSSRQRASENVPPTAAPSPRKGKGRASGVPPSPVSPARSSARLAAKQPSTPRKVNSTPKAKQRVGRAAAGTAHSPVKSSPLKQVAFRAPTVEVAPPPPEARSRWYIPKRKRSTDSLSISESSSSSSDSDSDSGSEYCD